MGTAPPFQRGASIRRGSTFRGHATLVRATPSSHLTKGTRRGRLIKHTWTHGSRAPLLSRCRIRCHNFRRAGPTVGRPSSLLSQPFSTQLASRLLVILSAASLAPLHAACSKSSAAPGDAMTTAPDGGGTTATGGAGGRVARRSPKSPSTRASARTRWALLPRAWSA
jgi:hypothetical protein